MGDDFFKSIVAIATAIVGVAIVASLVSSQAQTSSIITAAGNAFGQDLNIAVSPITGGSGSSLLSAVE